MKRISTYRAADFSEDDLAMFQIVVDVLPENSELGKFLLTARDMLANGDDIALYSHSPDDKVEQL